MVRLASAALDALDVGVRLGVQLPHLVELLGCRELVLRQPLLGHGCRTQRVCLRARHAVQRTHLLEELAGVVRQEHLDGLVDAAAAVQRRRQPTHLQLRSRDDGAGPVDLGARLREATLRGGDVDVGLVQLLLRGLGLCVQVGELRLHLLDGRGRRGGAHARRGEEGERHGQHRGGDRRGGPANAARGLWRAGGRRHGSIAPSSRPPTGLAVGFGRRSWPYRPSSRIGLTPGTWFPGSATLGLPTHRTPRTQRRHRPPDSSDAPPAPPARQPQWSSTRQHLPSQMFDR